MCIAAPRRIAHVTLSLDVGGQEKLLLEFIRHAERSRFQPLVIVLGSRGPLAAAVEALDCPVIALNEAPGLRPSRMRRLAAVYRAHQVDLVHTHDDAPLVYGMPAAWWAKIPARLHTHHHGRLTKVTRRQEMLIRWASRLTRRFVCVSHDSARYAEELGVRKDRIVTLHNGIDLERFPYHGPRSDGPVVTVARLSPEKDIPTLLHAARLAADAVPDFRLEIAGDGPCREDLHRLAAELRLQEHVRFLGAVSDVPALLARARLFVLASQTEGVSLTILEAMARGLPVVATLVGGNPEVVLQENSGLLVPAGNASALMKAMLRIYRNSETAQGLGLAGRRRVEAHFDVRHMVARYEALYDQVVAPTPHIAVPAATP
jgi:glycosyltransferase involved in cell wall biosynthesis